MQCLVCVRCPFDVELVAGRAVEGVLLVRTDLRLDVEGAQKREGAPGYGRAGQIEMQGDLPTAAQMHAAGDVEQPRELGETIAVGIRGDLGELVAQVVRE